MFLGPCLKHCESGTVKVDTGAFGEIVDDDDFPHCLQGLGRPPGPIYVDRSKTSLSREREKKTNALKKNNNLEI